MDEDVLAQLKKMVFGGHTEAEAVHSFIGIAILAIRMDIALKTIASGNMTKKSMIDYAADTQVFNMEYLQKHQKDAPFMSNRK